MYYVHYLGWNNRYDEWVTRQRIAQNLSWNQGRGKKGRLGGSIKKDEEDKPKDAVRFFLSIRLPLR